MADTAALPSVAVALALAILCSGCVATGSAQLAPHPLPVSRAVEVVQSPAPQPERFNASTTLIPTGPEDFVCADGARIEVSYSETRDSMSVRFNGAAPVALYRADEQGLTAYRSERLVLRRSGPRIAVSSEAAQVTVQAGDSLSRIALRIYGDLALATEIARMNEIANPDLIFPGQVLRLPLREHRCRRSERQLSSYGSPGAGSVSLQRRAFSPPSSRQPDLQRVQAVTIDPPLH